MRFLPIAALAALFTLSSSSMEASVLGDALSFNGLVDQVNTLNTPVGRSAFENLDSSVDIMGNPTLTPGDIVYGWIGSTQVTTDVQLSDPFIPNAPVTGIGGSINTLPNNSYIAAVFSGIVEAGPSPGDTFLSAINPTTATGVAATLSIPALLGDFSGAGQQLEGVTNAVAAVVSGSTANGINDLLGASASSLSSFFTASNFELDFALSTEDGFFQSVVRDSDELRQRAGLNVIAGTEGSSFDGSVEFLDTPVASLFPPPVDGADVALDNTAVIFPVPVNGFNFQIESSSIRVNVTPEPTSVIAWLGIASVAALRTRRLRAVAS